MLKFGSRHLPEATMADPATPDTTDHETGLVSRAQFIELLQRDVARGLRYGNQMAIVAFNVTVVESETGRGPQEAPSPAATVAEALRDAVRETDIAGRVDESRFVALLAECTGNNAEQFSDRLRTKLSTRPFARDPSGTGIYMQAWAAALAWTPDYDTAKSYLAAALAKLEATQNQLESAQSWYKGDS